MISFEGIHHVSLVVTDLGKSKEFYSGVLGLEELDRPPFDFPGAWYAIGSQQLHLIEEEDAKPFNALDQINTRGHHLALKVKDYHKTLAYLEEKNIEIVKQPFSTSGFSQIFCKDPDHNIIELNTEQIKRESSSQ